MATHYRKKIGSLRGIKEWEHLETIGDVKRFLRWVVHSVRAQQMDLKTAAVFANISGSLLKACDGSYEERLLRLEKLLGARNGHHEDIDITRADEHLWQPHLPLRHEACGLVCRAGGG